MTSSLSSWKLFPHLFRLFSILFSSFAKNCQHEVHPWRFSRNHQNIQKRAKIAKWKWISWIKVAKVRRKEAETVLFECDWKWSNFFVKTVLEDLQRHQGQYSRENGPRRSPETSRRIFFFPFWRENDSCVEDLQRCEFSVKVDFRGKWLRFRLCWQFGEKKNQM